MGKRNISLTFALSVSLIVHGGLTIALIWWHISTFKNPWLSALVPATTQPAPLVVQPPPEDPLYNTSAPLRDDSGETDGIGTANRSTPGDKPMQSNKGYEQANLTQNELKQNNTDNHKVDQPAQNGLADATDLNDSAVPQFGAPQVDPTPSRSVGAAKPISVKDPTAGAIQPVTDSTNTAQTSSQSEKPVQAANTTPPKEVKGIETTASDTESIPFAKANSVTFHDGKIEGRKGRRVRTTRINIGDSGYGDAISLPNPSVVLGVKVNSTGSVDDVKILRSSGSDNIDGPTQRAVYAWWFEPEKDKDGHPKPDFWVVTVF